MSAPDVAAGDALRSALIRALESTFPEHHQADAVLALPELRALIAERDEMRGAVEQQKALIARNHRAYLSIQGIDTSHLDGTGIATSRPRSDAQGVTGVSGSTRDDETVGDE